MTKWNTLFIFQVIIIIIIMQPSMLAVGWFADALKIMNEAFKMGWNKLNWVLIVGYLLVNVVEEIVL